MVWKSCVYRLYGPNVYVDKIKELVESLYLLMDIIICVIVTLLNDNWRLKLMGVVGGCSWR